MIHIKNKESILTDTEMTSNLGKAYIIIGKKSLNYF